MEEHIDNIVSVIDTTESKNSLFKYVLTEIYRRKNLLEKHKRGDAFLHASDLWKCNLRNKLDKLGYNNEKVERYKGGELLTYACGLGYEREIVDMYKRVGIVIGSGEENRVGKWNSRIAGISDIIIDLSEVKTMEGIPEGTLAIVELKTIDFLLFNKIKERPYLSNELQLLAYMYLYEIPRGYIQYFVKGGLKRDNCWKEFRYYAEMNKLCKYMESISKKYIEEWDNLKPSINSQCKRCEYLYTHCKELIDEVDKTVESVKTAKLKMLSEKRNEIKQKKIGSKFNKKNKINNIDRTEGGLSV